MFKLKNPHITSSTFYSDDRVEYFYGNANGIVIPSPFLYLDIQYRSYGHPDPLKEIRTEIQRNLNELNSKAEELATDWVNRWNAPVYKSGVLYASEYGFPPQIISKEDYPRFICYEIDRVERTSLSYCGSETFGEINVVIRKSNIDLKIPKIKSQELTEPYDDDSDLDDWYWDED